MSDRPHVCFVSDTVHSYFGSGIETGTGGAERQQYMLATGLRERGYDVSVATLKYDSPPRRTVDSISIWRVIPDVRGVPLAPYKAAETIRWLRNIDADVYYVRGNDFLCMVTAAYTRLNRRGFIYAIANDSNVDPIHLKRRGFLRYPYIRAMRSADCVVAQTGYQQDVLAEEHKIDALRIPNGYEVPPENELTSHAERDHVLWVGSMNPDQKKPKRFLELARLLPDIQFRIIGPPDNDEPGYYDEIESEARDISNLEFLGFVDPDAIHDHYKTAIALVNTSDYEGFPNIFLEAWRYATPVVSLYHTLDGRLTSEPIGIHAGSMDDLVTAVDQLATIQELRERLGAGGRKYMADNYSFDQLLGQYEKILQQW